MDYLNSMFSLKGNVALVTVLMASGLLSPNP